MSTNKIQAWHFVGETLRDGRPVPEDGVTLRHDGNVVLRESGLHGSVHIMDALKYATGPTLCRVECGGTIVHENDQLASTERKILWRINATDMLEKFARQCALDVAHLWEMPDIVREYLETGDETKRAAALAAAWAAAETAARAAVEANAATRAARAAETAAWAAARAARAARAAEAAQAAEAAARATRAAQAARAAEAAALAAAWAAVEANAATRAAHAAAWAAVEVAHNKIRQRQATQLKAMVEEYRTTGRRERRTR